MWFVHKGIMCSMKSQKIFGKSLFLVECGGEGVVKELELAQRVGIALLFLSGNTLCSVWVTMVFG